MKTPEDEAFDELARKQGAWGGGYQAKRQAAMDKVNADFDEEYIKYREAFPKEYTAPQPVQEPVAWQWLGSAHFRKKIPKNADITAWNPVYSAPPLPVQEPVAYVTGVYGGRFTFAPLNPAMVLPVGMALYAGPQREQNFCPRCGKRTNDIHTCTPPQGAL